ncbi:hypothetical protein XELAEV_18041835mg [Xenopus laevis]|uniref:GIY-YIG domain-containing protein n=1 Tax=Xenopus laevis TaxID=8355 RepID=A0A974H5J3_XENLA|nr:hypothetical protein XELAEV_18041835mg [Xenopus laevis]
MVQLWEASSPPSYANLFMGYWEKIVIEPILQTKTNLITWRRYIDDCIIIWKGSEELLKTFIQDINNNSFNLKFTYEYSKISIFFLDLNVYTTKEGLKTRLFKKETDCNGYIPYNSGHHRKWLNNIPSGQFGRIKRNCSNPVDYQQNCALMRADFLEKGYDPKLIEESRKVVDEIDRSALLGTKTKEKDLKCVPFITKFSKGGYKLTNIFKKHWHILQMDKDLRGEIGEQPSIVFTRPNTLRQSLAPSYLKKEIANPTWLGKNKGFFKCMQCIACKTLKSNARNVYNFKSNQTNKQYKINKLITCDSVNVVYLLECPCKKQYVGRTTKKLKLRIAEHIRNIKKGLKTHRGRFTNLVNRPHSVSEHFSLFHNSDPSGLKFMGIAHKVKTWRGGNNVQIISQEETRWIISLKTLQPMGLNIDLDINCLI